VRWMEANGGSIVNITADIWGGWARLGALWGGASRNAFFHRIGGDRTGAFRCQSQRRRARVRGFERHGPTLKAQAMFRRLRHSVPLKRLGTEAEVSAAASFLLSPASIYHGAYIRVDGAVPNARPVWDLEGHSNSISFNGFHRNALSKALKDT
jgi:citronellol/citronellal dehydrogenase